MSNTKLSAITERGNILHLNGEKNTWFKHSKLHVCFTKFFFNFSFYLGHTFANFKPIYCQSYKIGFVSNKVEQELLAFQDVFVIHPDKIEICPGLKSYGDISEKVASFLDSLKNKDIFNCLRGWRNETFDIRPALGQPPLFAMERSAMPLFGFLEYYISINAYVVNEDGSISVWLQRRALTKSKDPGKLDSFVSSAGQDI